ncbi:phospholysine phosphohistidine inorganic pyrophosphate phosphatase-like [Eriocheir sinensis]|uniref:phospholysine phosphohistidine inorganic pyrophosphate phosphatase-like n=1 Tax=Eriocheir sinensis TaxID=95602 RepID=UPI0021C6CD12|nr:phospholysine phosphohistidine inorganic pyrophosphate phosphatase-like [Eriocheir sinensis]
MMAWCSQPVRGVLLDITGVLYEGGSTVPIPGSVEAVERLKASGIGVRLVTNETSVPVGHLLKKLQGMGFKVQDKEVFSPIPAAIRVLQERGLVPHLLVNRMVEGEFAPLLPPAAPPAPPSCVVVGDADQAFNFDNMNKAFRALKGMADPVILSLGAGKFYRHHGELQLDVAPFVKALEWAVSGAKVEVVGKPSPNFFLSALSSMGVKPEEAVMVGDDLEGDVGGALGCGVRGVLLRTGKFTPAWENHPTITPSLIGVNLGEVVDELLG